MRVDQTTLAAHKAALLEAAGRLFRARGLNGVTVADVSRAAGLTHGAFYGHYGSKAAVAAESCRHCLRQAAAKWRARAEAAPDDPAGAIIDHYLDPTHRDDPGGGCALAALGQEAARDGGEVAAALAEGADGLCGALDDALAQQCPSLPADTRARRAAAILATMVGGVVLARALRPDTDRSAAALLAARDAARALIRAST